MLTGASAVLFVSRLAWAAARPVLGTALRARARRGREDAARLDERYGRPSLDRPAGPLCWVHAASLGEARSVDPLIRRLVDEEGLQVLVTTVTVTSAQALARSLPPRAVHQYAPLDQGAALRSFLDHWRPDCALRVESEFWPETLCALAQRGIPRAMVQARLSARSAARWRWLGGTLRQLLHGFDPVVAQTTADCARLSELGVAHVQGPLNLKADADAPAFDPRALLAVRADLAGRPFWLAASTHPGEEEIALTAHERVAARWPDLLTILLPRHPDRGDAIEVLARRRGYRVRRRSAGHLPGDGDVYIADTLGETGLFYRLAGIVLVGGTLTPRGGHNLLEPARLDCAILRGPDVANVADVAADLDRAGAAATVKDAETLGNALLDLLHDSERTRRMAAAAVDVAVRAQGVTEEAVALLAPVVEAARARHARP